jgi:uncharacterized protein (TIGR02588 family)
MANQTPLLEWVSAAIGLVLTLGVIGVIGWEALNADDTPAAIKVESLGATPTGSGYVLQVRVTNTGGSPAAQVAIEGELTPPGGEAETAEATFDYVPDHSTRTGGLFFTADPAVGALKLRAKGYVAP